MCNVSQSKYYREKIKVDNSSKINTISKFFNKHSVNQTSTAPEENDTCTRCSDPDSENEIEQLQDHDSENIQVSTTSKTNEVEKSSDSETDSDTDNSESTNVLCVRPLCDSCQTIIFHNQI